MSGGCSPDLTPSIGIKVLIAKSAIALMAEHSGYKLKSSRDCEITKTRLMQLTTKNRDKNRRPLSSLLLETRTFVLRLQTSCSRGNISNIQPNTRDLNGEREEQQQSSGFLKRRKMQAKRCVAVFCVVIDNDSSEE